MYIYIYIYIYINIYILVVEFSCIARLDFPNFEAYWVGAVFYIVS